MFVWMLPCVRGPVCASVAVASFLRGNKINNCCIHNKRTLLYSKGSFNLSLVKCWLPRTGFCIVVTRSDWGKEGTSAPWTVLLCVPCMRCCSNCSPSSCPSVSVLALIGNREVGTASFIKLETFPFFSLSRKAECWWAEGLTRTLPAIWSRSACCERRAWTFSKTGCFRFGSKTFYCEATPEYRWGYTVIVMVTATRAVRPEPPRHPLRITLNEKSAVWWN